VTGADVRIAFTPVGDQDVVGYRLYRSLDGVRFEKVENSILTGETPAFVNAGAAGTAFQYYVTAVDVKGNESPRSAIVQANGTGGAFPPGGIDPHAGGQGGAIAPNGGDPDAGPVPSVPQGLNAKSTGVGVSLTWQPNASDERVTSYHVWFASSESGRYRLLGSTETNQFDYISPLSSGWYRVTAVSAGGESSPSASVHAGAAE
jgi:penicillin-binding protein